MTIGTENNVIQGCGSHHIAIQTRDWDASLHLYQEVLGMKWVAEFGSAERKITLLDIGDGSHIELFQPTADTPAPTEPATNGPLIHFALATLDTHAAIEHVRGHGYEITIEPTEADLGAMQVIYAFFKGSSGEEIEFFQTL